MECYRVSRAIVSILVFALNKKESREEKGLLHSGRRETTSAAGMGRE